MAILASAQWWVRAGGNVLNGGGYDSGIAGAGTNYSDQDAPQLSLTDLATSGAGSATVTSATGGFTSAMVANCIRIASGTNFTAGYYFVTSFTSSTQVGLDRSPTPSGAGSGGVGRLGGAHPNVLQYATGGTNGTPTITSPLAAGHQVNIRGSGSDMPTSADYTHTAGYSTFPGGDTSNGYIKWIGYNGRPRFHHAGLLFLTVATHYFENLYAQQTVSTFTNQGFVNSQGSGTTCIRNLILDQNGLDTILVQATAMRDVVAKNTGATTAGSQPALKAVAYCGTIKDVTIMSVRGVGLAIEGYAAVRNVVIYAAGSHGVDITSSPNSGLMQNIDGITIRGCGGDGIRVSVLPSNTNISNAIIDSNGGYGINVTASYQSRFFAYKPRNCAFRNNTSGKYNNWSGEGDIDLTVDPFIDAAGGNFALNNITGGGALLRGTGYPTSFRGLSTTLLYDDVGAVPHQRDLTDEEIAEAMWTYANRELT